MKNTENGNVYLFFFQALSSDLGEDRPNFPGSRSNWTESLEFVQPDLYDGIPVYRVMNRKGEIIDPNYDPKVLFLMSVNIT